MTASKLTKRANEIFVFSNKDDPCSSGIPLGCILKNGHTIRDGIAYGFKKNKSFFAPTNDKIMLQPKENNTATKYPVHLAIIIVIGICQINVKNKRRQPIKPLKADIFISVNKPKAVQPPHIIKLEISNNIATDRNLLIHTFGNPADKHNTFW